MAAGVGWSYGRCGGGRHVESKGYRDWACCAGDCGLGLVG
jgi:hypothetical protein